MTARRQQSPRSPEEKDDYEPTARARRRSVHRPAGDPVRRRLRACRRVLRAVRLPGDLPYERGLACEGGDGTRRFHSRFGASWARSGESRHQPVSSGHRACITLWTDDVDSAYAMARRAGATDHAAPHPFLEGRLRVAFVEDPDGHPVQLVQRVG
ncbi:MAG: VOC family protein [Streptosporangiales bacterium]